MTYPADILSIICYTSQIGRTEVIGIIGCIFNLIWARNRWYSVLSSCIIWDFGALNSHVCDGAALRIRVL